VSPLIRPDVPYVKCLGRISANLDDLQDILNYLAGRAELVVLRAGQAVAEKADAEALLDARSDEIREIRIFTSGPELLVRLSHICAVVSTPISDAHSIELADGVAYLLRHCRRPFVFTPRMLIIFVIYIALILAFPFEARGADIVWLSNMWIYMGMATMAVVVTIGRPFIYGCAIIRQEWHRERRSERGEIRKSTILAVVSALIGVLFASIVPLVHLYERLIHR
jgi:hypothetical protein